MILTPKRRRRGTILPLVNLSLVAICGFVALAVDIGLIAVAKTQCQNAADDAAMAGCRSLDGTASQNLGDLNTSGSATYNAQQTALANKVLTDTLDASKIILQFGSWHYDTTNQVFVAQIPPVSPDTYTLCQVTVSYDVNTTFAPAFQALPGSTINPVFTVSATAQAAHRPRDFAIILDFSGSMNNESDL